MTCLEASQEAAVSLLDGTQPSAAVRAHLAGCPPCAQEYLELAELAPLLEAARDVQRAQPPSPPSPLLLDRLLAHVVRRRRRRRIAVGLTLAAAAAVLPLAQITRGDDRPAPPVAAGTSGGTSASASLPPGVVAAGSASGSGTQAQVWVRWDDSGSAVTVSVRGLPKGTRCRLIVHDVAGASTDAGVWTVQTRDSTYVEDVATAPAGIERIELVDADDGRQVLDVPVRLI